MEEGKPFYDVWMFEVSDEIQSLATAFGERYMLDSALKLMNSCNHTATKKLLESAIHLHAL